MKLWYKYIARKFLITIGLIITCTVLLCVHLLTGFQYVSLISLITAFYHGHDAYTTQNQQTFIQDANSVITPDLTQMQVKGSPGTMVDKIKEGVQKLI